MMTAYLKFGITFIGPPSGRSRLRMEVAFKLYFGAEKGKARTVSRPGLREEEQGKINERDEAWVRAEPEHQAQALRPGGHRGRPEKHVVAPQLQGDAQAW